MKIRPLLIVTTTSLLALTLAGCSTNSSTPEPTPSITSSPTPSESSIGGFTIMPVTDQTPYQTTDFTSKAYALSNQEFVVILGGSSSCPPTIENVSSVENGLQLKLKTWSGACTADFTMTAWDVSAPVSIDWDSTSISVLANGIQQILPINKDKLL